MADLLVGANGENGGGIERSGRVYVFPGTTSGLSIEPSEVLLNPNGGNEGMYGQTVAAADLFGDGVPDVVVTAPCEDLAGLRCVGRVHVYQRTASGTEVISLEPTVAAMDLAFGLRMVAIDASTAGRAGVRIATPFAGMGHVFAYRVEADGTLSGPVELDAPGLAAEAAFGYFMGAVGMWPVMGRSSSPSARRETRTPRGGRGKQRRGSTGGRATGR